MSLQLFHIGELLIAEMFNQSEAVRAHFQSILIQSKTIRIAEAVTELCLRPCNGLRFDGAHRIDVALLTHDVDAHERVCIPIEAKLGTARLTTSVFNERFLKQCVIDQHADPRISGNMIAVLERKLPVQCLQSPIETIHRGIVYLLTEGWVLVVRRRLANEWRVNGMPALSKSCTLVAIEDLVSVFGEGNFDDLVRRVLNFEYYKEWFGPVAGVRKK